MSSGKVGTIAVDLALRTAAFFAQIDKSKNRLKSIGDVSAKVSRVSGAAFTVFGGALALVTNASSEQIKSERQLAAAFRASGNALDMDRYKSFASALQDVTLVGDETTIKLGAMLAPFGLLQDQIQALIPGVIDLAASTGKAADTIANQLGRAISTGAAGGLSRYGVVLDDAERKMFTLADTTERTAMIVGKFGAFAGAAAAEAATAAGRSKQMSNALGDLMERIGAVVDAPLAEFFESVTAAIEGVDGRLATAAGTIALVGTAVSGLVLGASLLVTAFAKIGPVIAVAFGPAGILVAAFAASVAAVAVALADVSAQMGALDEARGGLFAGSEDTQKKFSAISRAKESESSGLVDLFSDSKTARVLTEQKDALKALTTARKAEADAAKEYTTTLVSSAIPALNELVEAGKRFHERSKTAAIVTDEDGLAAPFTDLGGPRFGAGNGGAGKSESDTAPIDGAANASDTIVSAGADLVSSMGDAGAAIGNVAAVYSQTGSVFATVIAAFMEVISRTSGFAKVSQSLNNSFRFIIETLDTVSEAIGGLFTGLMDMLISIHAIAAAIGDLDPGIRLLMGVLKLIGKGFSLIGQGLTIVFNAILEMVAKFVGIFSDSAADVIRRRKIDQDEILGKSPAEAATSVDDLGDSASDAAESVREMNAALTNVPSTFKIALRRFQSTEGSVIDDTASAGLGVGRMIVNVLDPQQFVSTLRTMQGFQNFQSSGSSAESAGEFATSRAGA